MNDDFIAVKTTINVSKKRIADLFVSACEGGSNYWCYSLTPHGKNKCAYDAMLDGFEVLDGEDNNKKHVVTKDKITKSLQLFATKEPRHWADFISESEDAETADVFLQLCVFGKVIYG